MSFTPQSTVEATSGCVTQNIPLSDIVSIGGGVKSDTTGITGATTIKNIVRLTQSQYNALAVKDANTLYVLT